jgi:hypothetical protein
MTPRNFFLGRTIGFIVVLIVLGLVGAFYWLNGHRIKDYKQAEYIIDGNRVRLDNTVTKYFGNEVKADLDGDGREDIVFLLTHQPGGSGTFYYIVAALNTTRGYVGSQAFLLGDRIAPQTTELGENNTVIVNYADRAATEPFSTPPSHGRSVWLSFSPQTLRFTIISPK